jgi:hypothetical protein
MPATISFAAISVGRPTRSTTSSDLNVAFIENLMTVSGAARPQTPAAIAAALDASPRSPTGWWTNGRCGCLAATSVGLGTQQHNPFTIHGFTIEEHRIVGSEMPIEGLDAII